MALNNVPLSGQTLNDTRDPIRNNFSTINTAFLQDHVEYNLAGQGKHNRVTMPIQVGDQPTTATEMALYTKNVAGIPQLFLRRNTNGAVIDLSSMAYNFTSSTIINGYGRLPGGILMKWGVFLAANGTNNLTYDVSAPAFTQVPVVILTPWGNAIPLAASYDVYIAASTIPFFSYSNNAGGNVSCSYLAIGTG